ncbi:MAG: beta-N-acetylglucosaminidase domain-containing protein [Longimicrobiales bacterium]
MNSNVDLGIIEGFYGRPWSWTQRADALAFLEPYGYRFYHYAPKADPYLRIRWQQDYPTSKADELAAFAKQCRGHGVRFGIGLSPVLHNGFDADAQDALARKLAFFDHIGTDDVALLFDDMTGATPDLADRQIEVVHWAAARTRATRMLMCPSYYTDDPVLDRVFGARPDGYVERLGAGLDRSVEIYWTGEEVVSRQFSIGHLERVTGELQRKPFLWDNYPVNDGARMSQYLYVRGFTGRPASMAAHISAHGINPAVQPVLSRIPAITLDASYREGDAYQYGSAMRDAAHTVAGESLGDMLHTDVLLLQDVGLDRLGDKEAYLRGRYEGVDHDAAREIVGWLDGDYRITDALVKEMAGNEQG